MRLELEPAGPVADDVLVRLRGLLNPCGCAPVDVDERGFLVVDLRVIADTAAEAVQRANGATVRACEYVGLVGFRDVRVIAGRVGSPGASAVVQLGEQHAAPEGDE